MCCTMTNNDWRQQNADWLNVLTGTLLSVSIFNRDLLKYVVILIDWSNIFVPMQVFEIIFIEYSFFKIKWYFSVR